MRKVEYRLYVPGKDGKLHLRIVENPQLLLTHEARSGPAYQWSVDAANEAVGRLLKVAPQCFPPGTRIDRAFAADGGTPSISFNQAFANPKWWQDSVRSKLAIYALVETAIMTKESIWASSGDDSLTFLVQGKPLKKLGVFDLSRAVWSLAPDTEAKTVDLDEGEEPLQQ